MGAIEDQYLTIQRIFLKQWRTWTTQLRKNLLSIPAFGYRWCSSEWRRRWSWRLKKESTHQTNKDKYSTVISWYCLVVHVFKFSWCVMHVWVFAFILLNCTWWVRNQWCCTRFHCYLCRLKPICWHIRSSTHS